MVDDIYARTIKMFGSRPEPAFETAAELKAVWGREWGCDTDVGKLKTVLMHRPGSEFDIIDKTKRIESIGSYGDIEEGWYFQSDTIPDLAAMQADHDRLVQTLKNEGVEVIMLEGEIGNRFKSCYTRDSSIAVKGGAIVSRLAPKMRRGEELCCHPDPGETWRTYIAYDKWNRDAGRRKFCLVEFRNCRGRTFNPCEQCRY